MAMATRIGTKILRMVVLLKRASVHAAACALARVDGKSPVDYLDEPQRETARRFARAALLEESLDQPRLLELLAREMH